MISPRPVIIPQGSAAALRLASLYRGVGGALARVAVVACVDSQKHDVEVKLLVGCTEPEMQVVNRVHGEVCQSAMLIRRE